MKKSWTKDSHQILEQATNLGNYNRWIVSLFQKHFGKETLEIGSGLGGLSAFLPKTNITLSDVRGDYFSYLKKHFNHQVIKLNIENIPPKNLHNKFDTIFSSNVFEHIRNDERALKNCNKLLNKEGMLLLFVPAGPKIYGSIDKAMGHFRRYTKEELSRKAIGAGFKIIKIKYVNFPGYFSWWLRGKMSSELRVDSFMASIFDTLFVPIIKLEKYLSIPFGQSLMLVAQKP